MRGTDLATLDDPAVIADVDRSAMLGVVATTGGQLRRGFELQPGTRALMVEDVVTTGLSSREAIEAVRAAGGDVIAEAALVDRSSGTADLGVPFFPLIRIDVPTYQADALPPELASIPAIKPGSRAVP